MQMQYTNKFQARIKKELQSKKDSLWNSAVNDMLDYKFRMGEIAGLNTVLEILEIYLKQGESGMDME